MQQSKARIVADGVMAGLIGGAVIAAWFFVFDAARGQPLDTPALLATALLHGARQSASTMPAAAWLLVGEYAIAHFAAFALIGAIGALLIDASERHAELFGILLIFTAAFQVFFISVVMLLGPAAQAAMPWWKVIIGNLMATSAMLAFFLWREPVLGENLLGPWMGVAREGVISGILGGVIVAVWFLGYDAAMGAPFHTPALLGAIIFNGLTRPENFVVTAALVLGYTGLHFFAFILFGIASAIMMAASEREPMLALGVFVLFLWFELCFFGMVTFLDQSALEDLGWWNIVGSNVLALAGIIAYYEYGHPRVVPRMAMRWGVLRDEAAASPPRA
jgi:hypothetical protein